MQVFINQSSKKIQANCSLNELIILINAKPPFAVAINHHFIPKNEYHTITLQENDRIEIISPITGG